MKKPFPSKVQWIAVWRHRYVILNFVNQVAHGSQFEAQRVVESYGGSENFAREFYDAARASIEVR